MVGDLRCLVSSLLTHTSLETYGAKVTQIKAPVGAAVRIDQLKAALKEKKYKVVTVTHVDTSTGVLSDVKSVAKAAQEVSPDTLVIICSNTRYFDLCRINR